MVKRKLAITKSPTKGKTTGVRKISGVKIKKILEHVSTEDFMKFNAQDAKSNPSPTASGTNSKDPVKSSKAPKIKGISKKDKMLFKKQRLLQKFDTISTDLKKGLSKKSKKKIKNKFQTELQISDEDTARHIEIVVDKPQDKLITTEPEEMETKTILRKFKDSKAIKTFGVKNVLQTCKSEKSARNTSIFKKAKNNSNKNRQKNFSRGLKAYKKQMKKEEFVENPLKAITERVNAYVRKETAV